MSVFLSPHTTGEKRTLLATYATWKTITRSLNEPDLVFIIERQLALRDTTRQGIKVTLPTEDANTILELAGIRS